MKTNKQVLDMFGQMGGARINRLLWIAGQPEHQTVGEILEDMLDSECFAACFPDIPIETVEEYAVDQELPQLLVDHDKFGFIAEVYMPEIRNMCLDEKGNPAWWSTSDGCCEIGYAYAETTDELVGKIVRLNKAHLDAAVKRARG